MNIRQIEYFVTIATAGSFTRAASQLRISQSALSRQMRLLEEDLGLVVLERHGRGVRISEPGQLLLDRAKHLLRDLAHTREEVISRSSTPAGTLHIGMPTSMRTLLTFPSVARFLREYPSVFINVVEDSSAVIRSHLLQGRIDIGLLSNFETTPVMDVLPLLTEQMFLVGPRTCGLAFQRACTLADVARSRLILPSHPSSLRIGLDRALADANLEGRFIADINSTLLFDMVEAGLGYTVFPYCGVHALLRAGKIAAAPIKGFEMSWVLVTSRERPLSLATRLFRERLVAVAQRAVDTGAWRTARMAASSRYSPAGARTSRKARVSRM